MLGRWIEGVAAVAKLRAAVADPVCGREPTRALANGTLSWLFQRVRDTGGDDGTLKPALQDPEVGARFAVAVQARTLVNHERRAHHRRL